MKYLKLVDDHLASYLKISSGEENKFTYYTFNYKQTEYWDILGVNYLSTDPLIVDIKLMYIDQDARDWEPFLAERDASGYVTVNSNTYTVIIAFFEMIVGREVHGSGTEKKYFSVVNREELLQFHYPANIVDSVLGAYYYYLPDEGIQSPETISLICLPRWSRANTISSLWFVTFSRQSSKNPSFDLVNDSDGLGTIRFNRQALEELIILLKENIF